MVTAGGGRYRPRRLVVLAVVVGLMAAACSSTDEPGATATSGPAETAETAGPDDAADADEAAADGAEGEDRPRGAVAAPDEAAGPVDDEQRAAVAALAAGGHVVYLRHAATEEFSEGPDVDLEDPATQRNLSDEGRRQAEAIGRGFERLDLPVGTVVSSPYWRARETAELAFGADAVSVQYDLLYDEHPDVDRSHLAEVVRELLAQQPAEGTNTVIVGHGGNLQGATRVTIDEGAAAVFSPTGDGADLVGVLPADAWDALEAPA